MKEELARAKEGEDVGLTPLSPLCWIFLHVLTTMSPTPNFPLEFSFGSYLKSILFSLFLNRFIQESEIFTEVLGHFGSYV